MYILTINGREDEGAYSVADEDGDQILYLFQEEDDAVRFALMLEDRGYPEMHVIEVEEDIIKKVCDMHDYRYTIITENDIVVPPEIDIKDTEDYDFI